MNAISSPAALSPSALLARFAAIIWIDLRHSASERLHCTRRDVAFDRVRERIQPGGHLEPTRHAVREIGINKGHDGNVARTSTATNFRLFAVSVMT